MPLEKLAALEHESWSGWTKWMLSQIEHEAAVIGDDFYVRDLVMQLPCFKRWTRQMSTPYSELSEKEKESDRVEVRKKLEIYERESPALKKIAAIIAVGGPRSEILEVLDSL